MQDLKNASQNDVVFTSNPPGHVPKVKGEFVFCMSIDLLPNVYLGLDKEVDKLATDSAKLVSAYNKLKFSHQSELPQTIEQVKQHITDLKAVLSKSADT